MSATIKPFTDEFEEYGRDESRSSGEASSISFPTSEDEVRAILRQLHADGVSVTVQGARTGLAAGAVPHGGHILNTSRMNRYLGLRCDDEGRFLLRVEPGVVLSELRKQLVKRRCRQAAGTRRRFGHTRSSKLPPSSSFPPTPPRHLPAWAVWRRATPPAPAAMPMAPCVRMSRAFTLPWRMVTCSSFTAVRFLLRAVAFHL